MAKKINLAERIMCTKNIVPHRNGSAKIDGRNEKTEKASES